MGIPFEHLEGKYEIIEKMSEGGMGAVYKVRHRLLEELRVIKVMKPQLADDTMLRARFEREAKIAVRLRHPNLAQIYDFALDDKGYAFIVMEFIDGVNLQELVKLIGRPSIAMVLEIAHQTLEVLEYIHRKDVIHRDVSPDNLLLTRDDEGQAVVKMIDLGIAKVQATESGLTTEGTFLGKVRYSSPEHFRSKEGAQIGPPADVYSFGIVLYELATGHHPIQGNSISSLIAGHLLHPPTGFEVSDPEGTVPPELRRCTLKALAKEPGDRFPSAASFAAAIDPLRRRHPLDPAELRSVFEVEVLPTRRMATVKPGSTQSRLNRHFGVTPTPAPEAAPPSAADAPQKAVPPAESPAQPASRLTETRGQVRALLLGAEKLVQLHHYDEARMQVRAALDLDPEQPDATQLLRAIDAADTKRKERREQAAKKIEDLMDAGDLTAARHELELAVERLGECTLLSGLLDRLQQAETARRDLEVRIEKGLSNAAALARRKRHGDAVAAYQDVLALDPANAAARAALEAAEAAHANQVETARRAQRIATTGQAIARLLAADDLDEAEAALDEADRRFPAESAFTELRSQLAKLRERHRRDQAESLCDAASKQLEAGDLQSAQAQIELALRLAPGHDTARELLSRCEQGLREQEQERARLATIRRAIRAVDRLIDAGRLETAYRKFEAVIKEHGDFEHAAELRERIENQIAQRRERESRARALVAEAETLADKDRYDEAFQSLHKARQVADDHPEIEDLITAREKTIRDRAERYRRTKAITEARASIEQQITTGNVEDALRELAVARRLFGDEAALADLEALIQQQKTARRGQDAERLLHEALSEQHSFKQVIAKLEEALAIDPGNERVLRVLAESRAAQHRYQQQRRAQAVAEIMAKIDALIAEGKLQEALQAVERAVADLGNFTEARRVRARLEQAMARRPPDDQV